MKPIRLNVVRQGRRSPDLTPVMDVVFILVVFFMVVSSFSHALVKPLKVVVPGAASGAMEPVARRVLLLERDGATLDGVAVSDMARMLASKPDSPLSIVVTEGAGYQALVNALDAAQAASVKDVRVETRKGEGQ